MITIISICLFFFTVRPDEITPTATGTTSLTIRQEETAKEPFGGFSKIII